MDDKYPIDWDAVNLLLNEYDRLSSVLNTSKSVIEKRKTQALMDYVRSVLDSQGIQDY